MLTAIFAAALILIAAGAGAHSDGLLFIGCLLAFLGCLLTALRLVGGPR